MVPQNARCSPAIRHAVIALGALYEQLEHDKASSHERTIATTPDVFVLENYVQAIGFLLAPTGESGAKVANGTLVTCVVLTCFEVSPPPRQRVTRVLSRPQLMFSSF